MSEKKIHCSIVIPVYFNEGSLRKTYNLLNEKVVANHKDLNFEIIFIDDGSGDKSLLELLALQSESSMVKVIKLSRNFGQGAAILAGFTHARGRAVVTVAADLQEPPEVISQMLDCHFKENYHIVIGTREARDESFFRRKTSNLFYSIIRKMSFPQMPKGGFDFFLISSKVKDLIVKSNEKNPFIQGQILWSGFKTKFIPYRRQKREVGKSRWTFAKKIKYLIDGMLAYSYLPLRFMTTAGIIISGLGFLYALVILISKIFGGITIYGWAPIMIVVLVLSGFQMLMLGIIGEYLWRTLDQVRGRDHFVIEEIYEQKND
ncbi:MAG: glycosyltransferase family 2 protein [bacterium]|nr:glycosyltransferase family 2 protein [bacterium]